jgi:hypothetical protein
VTIKKNPTNLGGIAGLTMALTIIPPRLTGFELLFTHMNDI